MVGEDWHQSCARSVFTCLKFNGFAWTHAEGEWHRWHRTQEAGRLRWRHILPFRWQVRAGSTEHNLPWMQSTIRHASDEGVLACIA